MVFMKRLQKFSVILHFVNIYDIAFVIALNSFIVFTRLNVFQPMNVVVIVSILILTSQRTQK
jgi:hypothetical protein